MNETDGSERRPLTSADWGRIDELFDAALRVPVGERSDWLAAHCADAPALRAEVERLLVADADTDGGLVDRLATGALLPTADPLHQPVIIRFTALEI